MAEIGKRLFLSLTAGTDVPLVLLKSSIISLLSCLVTIPYFYYIIFNVSHSTVYKAMPDPWALLFIELFLLFVICLLSSTVGLIFVKRYGLPGLWDEKPSFNSMLFLFLIGCTMIFASYFIFDRHFLLISPISYPKDVFYILTFPLKGALTEEVILRLGMVTIGCGLVKNKMASVFVVSIVASILYSQYFDFIGENLKTNNLHITQALITLTGNVILGYLFISKGLVYSMALKFVFGLKYLFVYMISG
jgi:hypothetical protein